MRENRTSGSVWGAPGNGRSYHRCSTSSNSVYRILCNNIVDTVTRCATVSSMINSFKHKGLAELFEKGSSRKLRQDLQTRSLRRLEALDQAESLTELSIPGFNFHGLQGVPKRYSIHVNGPWCITFEWEEGDALRVDLEQYH
jgi:toxin HigB-1